MKKTAGGGLLLSRLSDLGSRMSRTQQLGILTASMLLGTALIGITTIQGPWQESRRETGSQLEEEQRRSELLLAIQRKRDTLQKSEQELLLQGGAPALTGEVSHLAAGSQLSIESVAPQPDLSIQPYTQFQIEIVATARLENLLAFLRSIESHRPLLMLNEMEIGEAAAGSPLGVGPPQKTPAGGEDPQRQYVRMKIGAVGRLKRAP
ncbi:MAG: type 4a pilus biogenesis protein PilO [Candidatus Omnitrophica bacterium]|nr:type 4a pilus biogenesis protein PilO [Candidatus Omnitrophota bacterium]